MKTDQHEANQSLMDWDSEFHRPVMVAEVTQWMNLHNGGIYCDCTVGGAGHLLAMLETTRRAKFIGIDWDPEAISFSRERIKPYLKRCLLFEDNFSNLGLILDKLRIKSIDGVLFDLGVSYHQLITAERGFSFDREGRLLMQMSPNNPTLLEVLKRTSKEKIIQVLKEYGDVRHCRKIGNLIFKERMNLNTTTDLRNLIGRVTPRKFLKKNLHKIFQALRIWINDELTNLKKGIVGAVERLNSGARILVISYHSGEDRIVKHFFRNLQTKGELNILTKKVIKPHIDEVKSNPRSRSAKLRVGEKCVVCS